MFPVVMLYKGNRGLVYKEEIIRLTSPDIVSTMPPGVGEREGTFTRAVRRAVSVLVFGRPILN
jgi:hypothetical protein